ncbi:MAG: iron-sulfur cluster assembly scaffold protein [Candidatus Thermoplasmatota archaeon]|nr:iron-sulfur cluster assembly scaffold protein [Candidatus Thermoplasmatota archaeon]
MIDDDFVKMVIELQKKIEYDEEKTYSKIVINEYRNPTNFGVIENPDAVGIIKGPCGDTMKITLKIAEDIIQEARFWTDGCGATLAAGNMITKMAKGKKLQDADNINSIQILDALDGLPKEHNHCALLAVNTLHKAIKIYKKTKRKMI